MLSRLEIQSFRNLAQINIDCAPSINFISGANGTGKTAILEAIYLLGSGRSFRTHLSKELIKEGSEELIVRARFHKDIRSEHQAAVLRNRRGDIRIRLDHEDLRSTGELARLIPVMVIHPGMHELILGGPGQRRRFIDWGLFHVEQSYLGDWKRYQHALEQRNALLKTQKDRASMSAWTESVSVYGEALSTHRIAFVEKLTEELQSWCDYFQVGGAVDVEYKPGWDQSMSLAESLASAQMQCVRYRTTTVGPHRADLKINFDSHPAKMRASRGQMKMIIYALVFAQLSLYRNLAHQHACLLCDDPAAELDSMHQSLLIDAIRQIGVQAFLTGVDFADTALKQGDGEVTLESPPHSPKAFVSP